MEVESEVTTGPNWLDLPRDVTSNILQRLGTIEIVTSACQVCPLWWNICKDPLMWRTINIHGIRHLSYDYDELENICCNAIERSCNHLEEIDIELFGTDNLLKCIANNGSRLRRIRFVDCLQISDEGFIEAVKKLPQLETIYISESKLTKPCDDLAFIIAETMSGLNHLDIKGGNLTNVGLISILDKCPLLKYLDIRLCPFLNLSESLEKRCIDQIKDLKLPDSIYDDSDSHLDYTTSDDDDDNYDPYWF
ncbi:hypothetical protein TSUD_134700 [Trifolium subterraneum]|uniref:F-box domain-containing protein n=1 Tax=Trifolium subterraneum TaxID=3900 RepID=A0A2Z6NEC4_TRISU|nr:hypothetical protein TSUD_134700 [Trifolium subterraneum]